MADWTETYRGVVLPRHCDHYGHLNVRYYTHFFDDGGFHMWNQIGISLKELTERKIALVIANISLDFVHEVRAGGLILIKGAFRKMGSRSITYEQRMYDTDGGHLCAKQTSVEVSFDTETRQSAPMPEDIRALIEANIVPEEEG